MDIILKLEDKLSLLESQLEHYRNKYYSIYYKFKRYIYKQKLRDRKLKDLMEDLIFVMYELEKRFDKIDKLERDLNELRAEMFSLQKEIVRVNKKLYQIEESINLRWKRR